MFPDLTIAEYTAREYHWCCADTTAEHIAVWVRWSSHGEPLWSRSCNTTSPELNGQTDPFRLEYPVPLAEVCKTIDTWAIGTDNELPGTTLENF